MSTKIIVRFDDICPNLNWEIFLLIKNKLQDLGIRSLLGVIPDNQDKSFLKYEYKENFFDLINNYKNFGDTIAQHGDIAPSYEGVGNVRGTAMAGFFLTGDAVGLTRQRGRPMIKRASRSGRV